MVILLYNYQKEDIVLNILCKKSILNRKLPLELVNEFIVENYDILNKI